MIRKEFKPRDGWESKILAQGLVYDVPKYQGGNRYWGETAAYIFTEKEVDRLAAQAEELHKMCIEAAKYMASGEMGSLGFSPKALEFAKASLEKNEESFYGRFDVIYDGVGGNIKMLEYNGDTPTGMIEAGVAQWYWKEDRFPYTETGVNQYDQWSNLCDSFIERWKELLDQADVPLLHLANVNYDSSGEDWLNTAFLHDTAMQAGWETIGMTMNDIAWDTNRRLWLDHNMNVITNLFKLYPWEDMVDEDFGDILMEEYDRLQHWYEPAWKMFLSNKTLSAALWCIYPDHPSLLKSYLGTPRYMKEWVKKPIFGREGDGIEIKAKNINVTSQYDYSKVGANNEVLYQEYCKSPEYTRSDGKIMHPVLGIWMVDGKAVACGIREDETLITGYSCTFVPNLIDLQSDQEYMQ